MRAETAAGGQVEDAAIVSRRARVRAATSQEIIATARGLLVAQGSAAISLRAIAREMGMTAPALYRYFDSHEVLIHHVVADVFNELSDYVEAAVAAAGTAFAQSGAAPDSPAEATEVGLITGCQAFRRWSIAHPAEFGLIFGTPLPDVDLYHEDPLMECGMRFGGIFFGLYVELWQVKPFAIAADEEIAVSLRTQLERYRDKLGTDLPLGALQTFLRCWVSLYGTVALEVFGHIRFALDDSSPLFELMLSGLAEMIGLVYPLPAV